MQQSALRDQRARRERRTYLTFSLVSSNTNQITDKPTLWPGSLLSKVTLVFSCLEPQYLLYVYVSNQKYLGFFSLQEMKRRSEGS